MVKGILRRHILSESVNRRMEGRNCMPARKDNVPTLVEGGVRVLDDTATTDHVVLIGEYEDFSFVDCWITFGTQSVSMTYGRFP